MFRISLQPIFNGFFHRRFSRPKKAGWLKSVIAWWVLPWVLVLGGCSSHKQPTRQESPQSAQVDVKRLYYKLQSGNLDTVARDLNRLSQERHGPIVKTYWHLLHAWYALLEQEPDRALFWLKKSTSQDYQRLNLPESWRPNWIQAEALALKNAFLTSAKIRIYLSGTFGDEALEQRNQDTIWLLLLAIPEDQLDEMIQMPLPSLLKGWYELALSYKRFNTQVGSQHPGLKQWLSQYPNHPAALRLPSPLQRLITLKTRMPGIIAVLLPEEGPLSASARALRNGILYAYYQSGDFDNLPVVNFYDTHKKSLVEVYKQAMNEGAELIIGPLEKAQVQHMQTAKKLPIPTLALNYGERDKAENPENLYQFGLAAEDEAQAVAIKAWQDGHRIAGVLIPESPWGDRVFSAFAKMWHALGGQLAETQSYSKSKEINVKIQQLLNVTDSQVRAGRLKNLTGQALTYTQYRRQDLDMIFTAALPKEAKQIKPLMAYYFAKDIPLYGISSVNDASQDNRAHQDLNGIIISDLPWLIQKNQPAASIQSIWKDATRGYIRLYAMGYDAFRIGVHLQYLQEIEQARLYGATGALELDAFGQVVRLPEFGQFRSGRLVPIQAPKYERVNNHQDTNIRLKGRESSEALP